MTRRPKKRTSPSPAPAVPRHWMDVVRLGLLAEAVILAGLVIYLRFLDGGPIHLPGILASFIMLIWVLAPILIAYYAARPRKNSVPRMTWGLTGFFGGAAMIWYLFSMIRGEGGSTAALGLLVLPFYLFLAMLVVQLVPVILNMVRRHKL